MSTILDFHLKATGLFINALTSLRKIFKQYNYDKISFNKLIFRQNKLYDV